MPGRTAYFGLLRVGLPKSGETILFHAAAGGVGSIASGWAKSLGATVIGTVGSDGKINYAKSN